MYAYAIWRRAPFIALLIVIVVISYAPAVTEGTSTIRLSALTTPSVVTHVYVQAASVSLHRQGFLNDTGWTTISQGFPVVDLLSSASQPLASTISSTTVHSGRFDMVRIFFANSTIVIGGVKTPVAAPSPLELNMTLLVSPNGISDLLLLVAFDYAAFFENTPSLSFVLVRTSTS